MFAKELRNAGHTRKFSIRDAGASGWEVRDEQDDRVLKQCIYTDWHRVERAQQHVQPADRRAREQGLASDAVLGRAYSLKR